MIGWFLYFSPSPAMEKRRQPDFPKTSALPWEEGRRVVTSTSPSLTELFSLPEGERNTGNLIGGAIKSPPCGRALLVGDITVYNDFT